MASSLSASGAVPQRAEKRAKLDAGMRIMEEIRALGYIPRRNSEHDKLVRRYHRAVQNGAISSLQQQEAEKLTAAHHEAMKSEEASKIMEEIRAFGYIPKYSEDQHLARTYHQAVKDGKISSLDQEEAETLTAAQYGR